MADSRPASPAAAASPVVAATKLKKEKRVVVEVASNVLVVGLSCRDGDLGKALAHSIPNSVVVDFSACTTAAACAGFTNVLLNHSRADAVVILLDVDTMAKAVAVQKHGKGVVVHVEDAKGAASIKEIADECLPGSDYVDCLAAFAAFVESQKSRSPRDRYADYCDRVARVATAKKGQKRVAKENGDVATTTTKKVKTDAETAE